MGYINYKTLRKVVDKFGIKVRRTTLLDQVPTVTPSDWLLQTIAMANQIPLSNEKVKSERIISPVLSEVHQLHKDRLTLFSGEELNVSPQDDLNGACDFFFSGVPDAYLLEAPIVSLTEAKDEDLEYGIAQCTAQMIGAQLFNEAAGQPTTVLWGCSTTAVEWKFLKMVEKTLYVDEASYSILKLEQLLGAFHRMLEQV
ncbi:MAG: hypothetical protein AAF847_09295 [Bacteroidota bacterium]